VLVIGGCIDDTGRYVTTIDVFNYKTKGCVRQCNAMGPTARAELCSRG